MRVTVGTKVSGEIDRGEVVAMSAQWCIYRTVSGHEMAEPWDVIFIESDGPAETVSSIEAKDLK